MKKEQGIRDKGQGTRRRRDAALSAAITEGTVLTVLTQALRLTAAMEPAQTHVLLMVAAAPEPLMMSELARERGKTSASMTATIDQLEGKGLVMRVDGSDRRVIRVVATDRGREFVRQLAVDVVGMISLGGAR